MADDLLDLRRRAEEARALADSTHDPGARKTFLAVADTYGKLAERIEKTASSGVGSVSAPSARSELPHRARKATEVDLE